jgi:Kef-type K+ transport system membrane component KefB
LVGPPTTDEAEPVTPIEITRLPDASAAPEAHLALLLALVLVAAKLGGEIAVRLKQPAVLGELLAGIAIGSLPSPLFSELRSNDAIDILSRLGLLILMFEVGLECTVRGVLAVGASAAAVAVLGTTGSLAMGWLSAGLFLPGTSVEVHVFVGAAITATSVGITARVFKDLKRMQTIEARTILGAAILDDIMALVILSLVSGWVVHHGAATSSPVPMLVMLAKTLGFLALAIVLGTYGTPRMFAFVAALRTGGALLAAGLAFCFFLAWAAQAMGLAPLVGAFAAGLVLEDLHSARFVARGERSLSQLMEPISGFLVPIFFVLMGIRADVSALPQPGTLVLIFGLTFAAIIGKLTCALGANRGVNRLAVAAGMMPRGEVTLIFAALGRTLYVNGAPIIDSTRYSALVAVVILTTIFTPWALKRSLLRKPPEAVGMHSHPSGSAP